MSGLDAYGQSMGTISDNISNMNTIGYKRTETRFSTLVTTPASANSYSPGGVQSRTSQRIDAQGLMQSSASPTDIGIIGNGFFVVNEISSPTATSGQYQYTRAGAFEADKNGNLRNTAGKYLQGWPIDVNGNIPSNRSDLTALETVNISGLTGTASATTTVSVRANLQGSQAVTKVGPQDVTTISVANGDTDLGRTNDEQFTITSGSASVTLTYNSTPTATKFSTLNQLAALINAVDGLMASVAGASPALLTVTGDPANDLVLAEVGGDTLGAELFTSVGTTTATYAPGASATNMASNTVTPDFERSVQIFDSKGGSRTVTMGFLKSQFSNKWYAEVYVEPSTDTTGLTNGIVASGTVKFNSDGTMDIGNTSAALKNAIAIAWAPGLGLAAQSVTIDWGTDKKADGLSQFDSASQLIAFDVNGALFGSLSSVNINEQGVVVANFDNGITKNLYKLPLATFTNANGLQAKTGNAFIATDDSGDFNLQEASVGGAGLVASSSLEASTVDLAEEFTNMIITQRAFSASARIITTADEMLEELIRLKR
ncbi:MAG: flagellar hook-basal body complex protein [Proteobacteria bacterium]|nr:flagellar hook-basal body complex protein [Pseudomonadota bacterium]